MATLLAAMLIGCTQGNELADATRAADDEPADEAPDDEPTDDASDAAPDDVPGAPHGQDCGPDVREAVVEVVERQLTALADDDLETAHAQASDGFRNDIDLDDFRSILESFPEVIDPDSWTIGACATNGDNTAVLRVDVTGRSGSTAQLTYLVVDEPRGWGIAGATPLDQTGAPPLQDA